MAPALLGWAAPLPLGGEGDTVTLVSQMEKKGLEKASEMPKVTQGHGGRGETKTCVFPGAAAAHSQPQ